MIQEASAKAFQEFDNKIIPTWRSTTGHVFIRTTPKVNNKHSHSQLRENIIPFQASSTVDLCHTEFQFASVNSAHICAVLKMHSLPLFLLSFLTTPSIVDARSAREAKRSAPLRARAATTEVHVTQG